MARESVKRKPSQAPSKKRERYVPDWRPLRLKWDQLKDNRHLSQKVMGLSAGASEGAISQLLSGSTKLTVEWALQFATYMQVPVVEIWPDFPFRSLVPGNLAPDEVEIALLWRMVRDPVQKKTLAALLRSVSKAD
jgi:hypothetical protein